MGLPSVVPVRRSVFRFLIPVQLQIQIDFNALHVGLTRSTDPTQERHLPPSAVERVV